MKILNEARSGGICISKLCSKYGISRTTFYGWKHKYPKVNEKEVASFDKTLEQEIIYLRQKCINQNHEINELHQIIKKLLK